MPGLVPGIQEFFGTRANVNGQDKPVHDWCWDFSGEVAAAAHRARHRRRGGGALARS
jgi:hypothetical protein